MDFCQLIQPSLCHPAEAMTLQNGRTIHCNICQKDPIPDMYTYTEQDFENHGTSAEVAQAFYRVTGDDQIPMTFTIIDVEGILSNRVKKQPLRHVRECIRLLRAINAPFTTHPTEARLIPEMNTFFQYYLDRVIQPQGVMDGAETILNEFIRGIYQMVQSKEFSNPFELYFEKLVPYVQSCVTVGGEPYASEPEHTNPAIELLIQLQKSSLIRKKWSPFSIPFDIIHVIVGSFSCLSDTEMVSNWILDLMARVCRGQYFWKAFSSCHYVISMKRFLAHEITYKKNVKLYHVIRSIRLGEASENLSTFWPYYIELQAFVSKKLCYSSTTPIMEMVIHQMFPAVLFESHSDYLGFALSLGHIVTSTHLKTGVVQKGTFKEARQIHEIVKKFVEHIVDFEQISADWTLDTLKMFLLKYPEFEQDIQKIITVLCRNPPPPAEEEGSL